MLLLVQELNTDCFGLINRIDLSSNLSLQLVVTGAHLSPEFGLTVQEIVDDGYYISRKIKCFSVPILLLALPSLWGLEYFHLRMLFVV